jgi:hypothetical protein
MNNHYNLLQTFVNYDRKKFYKIAARCQRHKTAFLRPDVTKNKLECFSVEPFQPSPIFESKACACPRAAYGSYSKSLRASYWP